VERIEETKMQIEGANGVKLDFFIESRTIKPQSILGSAARSNLRTEETKGIPKPEEFRMGNFDTMA
jgi:hypothetical protein